MLYSLLFSSYKALAHKVNFIEVVIEEVAEVRAHRVLSLDVALHVVNVVGAFAQVVSHGAELTHSGSQYAVERCSCLE